MSIKTYDQKIHMNEYRYMRFQNALTFKIN